MRDQTIASTDREDVMKISYSHLAALLAIVAAAACTPDNDPVGPSALRTGRLVGDVTAGTAVVPQIAAGGDFSCALSTNGVVTCWGDDPWSAQVAPAGVYKQIE